MSAKGRLETSLLPILFPIVDIVILKVQSEKEGEAHRKVK
jgi:hypothetical protein